MFTSRGFRKGGSSEEIEMRCRCYASRRTVVSKISLSYYLVKLLDCCMICLRCSADLFWLNGVTFDFTFSPSQLWELLLSNGCHYLYINANQKTSASLGESTFASSEMTFCMRIRSRSATCSFSNQQIQHLSKASVRVRSATLDVFFFDSTVRSRVKRLTHVYITIGCRSHCWTL